MVRMHIPRLLALVAALSVAPLLNAARITAGPMVGAPEMRAMPLWVQLDGPGEVQFAYWPSGQTSRRAVTAKQAATRETGYTVTAVAAPLEPGMTYDYEVIIDGSTVRDIPHDTRFSTTPFFTDRAPPPDFTVALGSGHIVNDAPYDPLNRTPGGGYSIFLAILAKQPDLMIWAGDAVNLREPDWGSREGMIARYSKNRARSELQPLLAAIPHAAAFGRGEFGPDNTGKHFRNLEDAHATFELFWPNPPAIPSVGGQATSIRYGDAEFFLVDDRTFRDLEHFSSRQQILGEAQIEWLRRALQESTATFKVVVTGSPALSPSDSPRNLKAAAKEHSELMEVLRRDEIDGLIFVAGGKAFGELTKMVRANAPDLYELTVGPLTDRPAERTAEMNFYREPNTSTFTRQFATLRFHGPEGSRQITLTVFDTNGTQLWTKTLAESQMRF